jgi:histidinol-phosphate/aromatic aminotransferase/cobyric acid decarboxylase-like protein
VSAAELTELGVSPQDVLDLSVNVNPWGPHPAVVSAIQRASIASYPQPWAASARAALARLCDIDDASVVVGHGSTELIWSAVALLIGAARPLLIAGPTFCEPALAAHAYGVRYVEHRGNAEASFELNLTELSAAIERHDAQAVYLCQPNNPDGACLPATSLRELFCAHRSRLFVLDQAFLSLSSHHAEHRVRFPDNVLVVRSLTKEHALPGLRAGYAVAAPGLIERINTRRPSWMVSNLAEAAIVEACAQQDYVARARSFLLEGRAALVEACASLGLRAVPSTTSYFLLHVGDADGLRRRLLARHSIAVRSCSSFGLPEHLRIAACGPDERARLMAALRQEIER